MVKYNSKDFINNKFRRIKIMSKVYDLVKDDLGISKGNPEEKALRMARLTGIIVEKMQIKNVQELADASIVAQTVLPEHMDMYQGKNGVDFDRDVNAKRDENSLLAVKNKVQLTDFQKDTILGKNNESKIVKLAESIIAIQYQRIQGGNDEKSFTDIPSILSKLKPDQRTMLSEQDFEEVITTEQQEYQMAKDIVKKSVELDFSHKQWLEQNGYETYYATEHFDFCYQFLTTLTSAQQKEFIDRLENVKNNNELENLVKSCVVKSAIQATTLGITPEAAKIILEAAVQDKSKANPGE